MNSITCFLRSSEALRMVIDGPLSETAIQEKMSHMGSLSDILCIRIERGSRRRLGEGPLYSVSLGEKGLIWNMCHPAKVSRKAKEAIKCQIGSFEGAVGPIQLRAANEGFIARRVSERAG